MNAPGYWFYTEDRRYNLQQMTNGVTAARLPLVELVEAIRNGELHAVADEDQTWINQICHDNSRALTVPYWFPIEVFGSGESKLNAATVQLAIELYRREHGDLPGDLEELVPDYLDQVPIDVFSGKPLLYRVDDEQVVVYSVGRDGEDNQGDDQYAEDVVVRVQRLPMD